MINSAVLVGRLTKDIEIRMTTNGKAVAGFSLAVRRDKDNTEFVPCRAYGKTAELLSQYCKKGSQVGLRGFIHTYKTDNNGQAVYRTEVIVDEITFLDTRASDPQGVQATAEQEYTIESDDLPF